MPNDKNFLLRLFLYILFAFIILRIYFVEGPSWLAAQDYKSFGSCGQNLNEIERGLAVYKEKTMFIPTVWICLFNQA
ncbi:MAG: hypothetical protein LWY06_09375 [Firmicutes bacterium]|nr:hypothetical protein [Bacillota bacterium]